MLVVQTFAVSFESRPLYGAYPLRISGEQASKNSLFLFFSKALTGMLPPCEISGKWQLDLDSSK